MLGRFQFAVQHEGSQQNHTCACHTQHGKLVTWWIGALDVRPPRDMDCLHLRDGSKLSPTRRAPNGVSEARENRVKSLQPRSTDPSLQNRYKNFLPIFSLPVEGGRAVFGLSQKNCADRIKSLIQGGAPLFKFSQVIHQNECKKT